MSRAFVKEMDSGDVVPELPDRPVSGHRNFVTESGLSQMDDEIARLRDDLGKARAAGEASAIASALRDLRYWTARRTSAEVVTRPTETDVRFGTRVTIERGDGRRQTFQITGEDEADPKRGSLSYVSPLARALIGRRAGDEVEFMGDSVVVLAVGDAPLPPPSR